MTTLDILCLGEPLVEFSDLGGGRWLEGIGGDVSNVAIAARRHGARAGIATRIGRDCLGAVLMRRWADEQIDTQAVAHDDDAPTGLYFVRHDADGHHFEYCRAGSAASRLAPDSLPRDAIRSAALLHLSGITQAISSGAKDAGLAAMAEARAAGVKISYDPNLRLKLWPLERARMVIHEAMRDIDVALPGLDDARLLTGLTDPAEIVAFYRDLGAKVVALTLGADGALVAYDGGIERVAAFPARAVDATGAGDCFDGAFLARWLETGDPVSSARYAVVAAGLSVESFGAVAPIPTRQQVEAAMAAPAGIDAGVIGDTRSDRDPRPVIALVAHDACKDRMIAWARRHHDRLARYQIVATGTTGARLAAALPDLDIRRLKSGPLGGDQQIGALIAEEVLDALVFFVDPLSPMPHDVDVKALTRLATVYDLPMACSEATADLVIRYLHQATR
ncbi:methylglyoxal synthase [Tistrella sp. BH-R2-4]|uniref:Methylglyoxal synthase n=1 Tax=Tistrella arctica TaxID=3133430 RepID=A0ABU9YLX0_9PROT